MNNDGSREEVIESIQNLLHPNAAVTPTKSDLQRASQQLKMVVPYNYEAWRTHADILLNAIRQLETRQLEPDDSCTLFITPLREEQLRNTAENALRQCAHFADSEEKRIALVDEANKVRNQTWF
jgi:Protein kinase G tetratricopeptide repeat